MVKIIFYYLVSMSIMGTVSGLVIMLIIKLFNNHIPKRISYVLWGIVAFRLLLPVSLSSKYSLANLLGSNITKAIPLWLGDKATKFIIPSYFNCLLLAEDYSPLIYKSAFIEKAFNVSGMLWVVGVVLFILVTSSIYLFTMRCLRSARLQVSHYVLLEKCRKLLKLRGPIRVAESTKIKSPFIKGIFYPTVVLPNEMDKGSLKYVLLHECSHIKRHDNIWRLWSIFIVVVHWFNPFVWLFLSASEKDMEKACDEKVLNLLTPKERKEYATVLIEFAQNQSLLSPALSNTTMKERIVNIANFKNFSLVMIVLSSVLIFALALVLLSNPLIK